MAWDIGAIEMGATQSPPPEPPPEDTGHPSGGGGSGGGISGGGSGGGFGGGRIGPEPIIVVGRKPLLLAKLSLDQGTEYESDIGVRHPDWFYKSRVIQWGTLTRELSGPPPTLPIISSGELSIEDTHGYWRTRLADITQRRRPIEIRLGEEGGSVNEAPIVYTGEIDRASYPPGLFKPMIKDIWSRWMKRQVPPWIDRLNYPNQPEGQDSGFFPIIFGRHESDAINPQGVIPLLLVDTLTNDYALNRTRTKEVIAVYRKLVGDELFTLVSSSEYSVVEVPKTIGGYDYDFITYVRFNTPNADGALIRADVDGVSVRGTFLNLPPIVDMTIRNVVDHIINMMYFLFVLEQTALEFDEWAFYTAWTKHNDLGILIDIAFTEQLTFGELIGQLCYNGLTDIYQTKYGKIAVEFTTVENVDRPVFDDTFDILRKGSFDGDESDLQIVIADIPRTINQFEYHFRKNYATNEWMAADFYNNATDQAELGEIEHDIFEFTGIRDEPTMSFIIRLLSFWYSLRTKIVRFFLSAPRGIPQIELAQLIGLTYYAGWGGPWVNEELKVYGLSHQLERHELEVTAITHRYVPIIFGAAILSGTGSGESGGEAAAGGCPGLTGPAVLDFGETEIFTDGTGVDTTAQVIYDPADYPGQTSARFRAVLAKDDVPFETGPSIQIVDENGTVYLTPTITFETSGDRQGEAVIDEAITLDPVNPHTYYIRYTSASSFFGAWQISQPRLWVFFTASDQAKFMIPLAAGMSFDGFGGYLTNSTSYVAMGGGSSFTGGIFKKDAGKFSVQDYWQAYVIADPSTKAASIALFNQTTNQMVAGTEQAIALGNGVDAAVYSVQFSPTATNFDDDADFQWRLKRTGPSGNAIVVGAVLYVKVGSGPSGYFTDPDLCAESAHVYVRGSLFDCEVIYQDRAYQFNDVDWPPTTLYYWDATGNGSGANVTLKLKDTGTIASPTSPPTTIDSLTFPTGPYVRLRTIAFNPVDGSIYSVSDNGTEPFTAVNKPAFIIQEISGP